MITIFNEFGYDLTAKDRFNLIKQAGFDGTMLWWGNDYNGSDFHDHPRYARDVGLFVENIHVPNKGNNNLWLDTLDGQSIVENLIQVHRRLCQESNSNYGDAFIISCSASCK